MGEFQKTWFQIVWACLLLTSIVITYIQRMSDALWAHSEVVLILDRVLMWVMLPLSAVMFVCLCIGYWRQSERLFWRKWRRWGVAIAAGIVLAVILLLTMRFAKGDSATLDPNDKRWILALFTIGMLIWIIARHKFRTWRKQE